MKAKRAWIVIHDGGETSIFFYEPHYLIGKYKVVPIVYFEIDEN